MRIAILSDMDLIRETITNPAIYGPASDDMSPSSAAFEPRKEAIYWGVYDDRFLGLFMGLPVNGITLDLHVCMLPHAWGSKTKEAARLLVQWLRDHTRFSVVLGAVGETNTHALSFAKAVGLREYARLPNAWLKGGKFHGLVLLSMEV